MPVIALALAWCFLSALLATAPASAALTPVAIGPDTAAVVPLSQVLELELSPAAASWSGSLRAKLDVRRPTTHFWLRLTGAEPSRVELADAAGNVPLVFGWHGRDTLLIETREPLAPGPAAISVSFSGGFATSSDGISRPDAKHVVLERGSGRVVPQWPAGTPETPWRLFVHAPAACDVIASLPRATRSLQRDWGTWEFASPAPMPADSLRAEVRPLVPHAVRKAAVHRRRRHR